MGNVASDHRFNDFFQYTYNKHLAYFLTWAKWQSAKYIFYVGNLSFAFSLHNEMAWAFGLCSSYEMCSVTNLIVIHSN